jgi:hypothetical protein
MIHGPFVAAQNIGSQHPTLVTAGPGSLALPNPADIMIDEINALARGARETSRMLDNLIAAAYTGRDHARSTAADSFGAGDGAKK